MKKPKKGLVRHPVQPWTHRELVGRVAAFEELHVACLDGLPYSPTLDGWDYDAWERQAKRIFRGDHRSFYGQWLARAKKWRERIDRENAKKKGRA